MFIQRSPVEMQTPMYWNLIGRNMTATPPVLSPSSIILPPSSQSTFIPARKYSARVSKYYYYYYFLKFSYLVFHTAGGT
jgi:hypothetical protein